ncbi:hypothetical protein C8Q80DRAFT_208747 [Daedaleopsis nitida]|nr:hypothetical protein C8Q80DRAFT_208747 [Daedaleopsis nitida]
MAQAPLQAFMSSWRIKDNIAHAYSTYFNPRNLEAYWYPPYILTISDVFDFVVPNGSLSAVQQFYLYLASQRLAMLRHWRAIGHALNDVDGWSDDENNDGEQGEDDDEDGPGVADVSIQTDATVPDADAANSFPDIMLLHIQAIIRPPPALDAPQRVGWHRRHGERVYHKCFPIIGELKRSPSRGLRGAEHDAQCKLLLNNALHDLVVYVAMYFDGDPHAQVVIGVVGAGPWWQWVEIQRGDVPSYAAIEVRHKGSNEKADAVALLKARFNGRPLVYLGHEDSDQEWTALRAAVVHILDHEHASYRDPPEP